MAILSIFDKAYWDIIPIFLILFTPIYGILLWNTYSLRQSSNVTYNSSRISDDKYFELKYRQEYIVVIFSVVATAVGILGYKLDTTITADIKNTEQKVISLNDSLKIEQDKIAKYQYLFNFGFRINQIGIKDKFPTYYNEYA